MWFLNKVMVYHDNFTLYILSVLHLAAHKKKKKKKWKKERKKERKLEEQAPFSVFTFLIFFFRKVQLAHSAWFNSQEKERQGCPTKQADLLLHSARLCLWPVSRCKIAAGFMDKVRYKQFVGLRGTFCTITVDRWGGGGGSWERGRKKREEERGRGTKREGKRKREREREGERGRETKREGEGGGAGRTVTLVPRVMLRVTLESKMIIYWFPWQPRLLLFTVS